LKFKILLIGAGQLGSRYLQGLICSNSNLSITVVDQSSDSLETARSRWLEVGGDACLHQISWMQKLPSDSQEIDIALVVTSSHKRADLISTIADSFNVRFWVIEKVLAQSCSEILSIQSATRTSSGSWVNIPRRMMKWHKSLKEYFYGHAPVSFSFSGGLWGLACNSIHFIDLVAWWTGESLVSVDCKDLDHNWHESKRTGYYEVTGSLKATFSGGSLLQLTSKKGASDKQHIRVKLNNGVIWEIDESAGIATSSEGQRIGGQLEFQSQLSGRLVDNILQDNKCDLPSLDESAQMHSVFLNAMLNHWNHSQNRDDIFLPIT
jgi:predicted dehydrogenase